MTPRLRAAAALVPLALLGLAATPHVPWEELTEADWIYGLATRESTVEGGVVHYPTPTRELASALQGRAETAALRHLADARLALGDRPGALQALQAWAGAEGGAAWADAARWCATNHEWAAAFQAAERALAALPAAEARALADEQVIWADAHPDLGDRLAARQKRAELFPGDEGAVEDWIRALEEAGRLAEAEAALGQATALSESRRALVRSDLLEDHADKARSVAVLEAVLDPSREEQPLDQDWLEAWAQRVGANAPTSVETWRATLDRAWDARALVRLATYFQGQGRGDAALDLLRQVERRHEAGLDRAAFLQLSRHYAEIDAVPEAFRARLAAAQKASAEQQQSDLAALARLALRAGGRALPWGSYNDEPYRWVARLDRTPGFWSGGLAFLMTGQDWKDALARLESQALPERTFATARLLADELARRAPSHPGLPDVRARIMERHVERGEGREALKLLPLVEAGPAEAARRARRAALQAARQVEVPVAEEARLYRSQLRAQQADGTRPSLEGPGWEWLSPDEQRQRRLTRRHKRGDEPGYKQLLDEAVARLDERDGSHRAALELLLGELDRLPEAEALWLDLAQRIEGWNLDDELGPRYERALERFGGPTWWDRLARFYARRSRQAELRRLADDLVARFRGSEIFSRAASGAYGVDLADAPAAGKRVTLSPWADLVRLKALERFPHSPTVVREAAAHLARTGFTPSVAKGLAPVRVGDDLLRRRQQAVLFVDGEARARWLDAKMKDRSLGAFLAQLEALPQRTPVEDRLLVDGLTRLSEFERAAGPADRLSEAYPGDADLALQALRLHRSLNPLDPAQAAAARAVVERSAPGVADATTLWTELGELEQERGHGPAAVADWQRLLEREPRSPERIEELATLLWDYGYMREALKVVEDGRLRLKQPWLLAFEAGVLREELGDLDGAVDEYLASARPNREACFCDWFEADQRALRRLSQLAARDGSRRRILARIESLQPGVAKDEQALVALLPLPTITQPDTSLEETVDDWIDQADQPNDPVGREQRADARETWLPKARQGLVDLGDAVLTRALALAPRATQAELLDKLQEWQYALLDARWVKGREVDFQDALLARRAELAGSPEERVAREVERARFLLERGRQAQSDALWAQLDKRIGALPQGAPRLRAEAERAGYVERARGVEAAAQEWQALTTRYPWSKGLLEDRLAFLNRTGRGAEARAALEQAAPRAAAGHREPLLERLAKESLEARDLPQARRAVERLLGEPSLDEGQRLGALHLLARLRLKEQPQADLLALAQAEGGRLPAERQADVYQQLARAADAEKQHGPAQALWIEALNRRLERDWLAAAWRSAERAGRTAELQSFFERQRERSPRDVRWAVAVRELRLRAGDLEGAIAMARSAVEVRPERESLWREAADLMVRAGRPAEAADFLARWQEPRPLDEDVVQWRAGLFARAGLDDKAVALEKAQLEAYAKESAQLENGEEQLASRRARAIRRLIGYGLPQRAWRLATPTGDSARVDEGDLSDWELARLALANDRFVSLLAARADDEDYRQAAAQAFEEQARPEQREELLRFLEKRIFPATAAAWPGDPAALRGWWSFAETVGLEDPLRAQMARRCLQANAGPWSAEAPAAFVAVVGRAVLVDGGEALAFQRPDLERLWLTHLTERERVEDVAAFVAARWDGLVAQALAETPLPPSSRPPDWVRWVKDSGATRLLARWLEGQPERRAQLGRVFTERRAWDRFWALAVREEGNRSTWDVTPLLLAAPDEAREAWFRRWQSPSPDDPDPVLRARGESAFQVTRALARLVTGVPGAEQDPLVARLRGPRSVGELLGGDARFTWPEFAPRLVGNAGKVDEGEARVTGRGADTGRLPGVLWGERPGQAWFALETLARLREKRADAALVPLEVRERGGEGDRTRLAARLADALGDNALALDIEGGGVSSRDLARFRSQLERQLAGRAAPLAEAALRDELRRQQARLDEAGFRSLQRLAEDLSLPAPFELLDRATPVSGPLLAYLCDVRGAAACGAFRAADVPAFRSALARRWADSAGRGAPEVALWLDQLWATGASGLPRNGLAKLGGLWPQAADWLATLPATDRAEGLAALRALPDAQRLEALLDRSAVAREDVVRLLRLRLRLQAGDTAGARRLFDELLAELRREEPLTYASVTLSEPAQEESGEEAPAEESAAPAVPENDPLAARLAAWVRPFREAGQLALVKTDAATLLSERRHDGPASAPAWRLALELAAPEERTALLDELERAWVRGEAPAPLPLAEVLAAVAPAEGPRWLARAEPEHGWESTARRVKVLERAKDVPGAARTLLDARARGGWTGAEEVRAFDLWRTAGGASAPAGAAVPAAWSSALPFWRRSAAEIGPELAAHLARHPLDLLSARAALRTLKPADEAQLEPAAQALQGSLADKLDGSRWDDRRVLHLRMARAEAARSAPAAQRLLAQGSPDLPELRSRRFPSAEIDAALADVVRVGGDAARQETALAALEDRNPAEARKARAAAAALRPAGGPRPWRLDRNGRPHPWLPRDLDWGVVTAALAQEAHR